MGMFDVEEMCEEVMSVWKFEERYKNIADKFKSMFDLPIPLLVEDSQINPDKNLKFSPELIGLNRENILFYDLSKPINKNELATLFNLFFLWTTEGIILSNIDKICPDNLPDDAQELITDILTEKDRSSEALFFGNPPTFLSESKNEDEKIREKWDTSPEAPGIPKMTGRIKVALICKEFPEYLKDKNIFCSKILMGEK